MTHTEIVSMVMRRLNLTSNDARVRIGDYANDRYRRVVTSVGLITSQREVKEVTLNFASNPDLPEVQLPGISKIIKIWRRVENRNKFMKELSYDEILDLPTLDDLPQNYAIKRMGTNKVIIVLDGFPQTGDFTLHVEYLEETLDLQDDDEPDFPANFHDIIVEGAMSEELRKMEKPQLAALAEQKYEARLSDLRMFIAKSAYLDIYQGKTKPRNYWYWPWGSRIGIE